MITRQFLLFVLRWILNSFGLWVAARILQGHGVEYDASHGVGVFLLAGFILSVVNAVLKPLVVILSLPAILLTLGLFTIIVNGLMVYLAAKLVPDPALVINFWPAVLVGMIIGLINYVLTSLLDIRNTTRSTPHHVR